MPETTVIFVHGINSDPDCWKPFRDRLAADSTIPAGYRFDVIRYPAEFVNPDPRQRIPRLKELGDAVGSFLKFRYPDAKNVILVGHSQGGLAIQSYLKNKIDQQRASDLATIRSVVLFATPNRGSEIASTARKLLFSLVPNPQERTLRVLDPDIADLTQTIERNILDASSLTDTACPIPFQVFWGLEDNVVPEASARGSFPEASPLPGNHSTILRPDPNDPQDERYLALRSAILAPIGHPSVFEIDRIQITLQVFPYPADRPYLAHYAQRSRSVSTDNRARRLMEIFFSPGNRAKCPYMIRYRTRSEGFVRCVSLREPNLATSAETSTYLETGTDFTYRFKPEGTERFWSDFEIFKGFDAGHRDWHDHLPRELHCNLYRFTLDLKAYLDAGFTVSPAPAFYYRRQDVESDDEIPDQLSLIPPVPPLEPLSPGLWSWELSDIRGGIFDLRWDLAAKTAPAPATPSGAAVS